MYKKTSIALVICFALLLESCSSKPVTITSIPPTSTITLTPAPTITPTITPSPTETPDPNKPADAMGKDINGYYKDAQENGKTVRYTWNVFPDGIKGWFNSHIIDGQLNGGIPLYDAQYDTPLQLVPFYFYVQEGLAAPYLRHPAGQTNPYAPGFSLLFRNEIGKAYFYPKSFLHLPLSEYQQFYSDYQSGKVAFPFTTSTGQYIWRLSQTSGYKFFAINWDSADPVVHPEFHEWHSWLYWYRWAMFSDADGNLIVVDALKYRDIKDAENVVDDDQLMWWLLPPMQEMLLLRQLPAQIKYMDGRLGSNHLVGSAFTSACNQVKVQNGSNSKVVDACVDSHFEVIRNP